MLVDGKKNMGRVQIHLKLNHLKVPPHYSNCIIGIIVCENGNKNIFVNYFSMLVSRMQEQVLTNTLFVAVFDRRTINSQTLRL